MYSGSQQERLFRKKLERIHKGLATLHSSPDPSIMDEEVLHEIRVSFKHLKSLLLFAHTSHKSCNKHLPKKILTLYSLAGHIRSAQLSLSLYRKYNVSCPSFLQFYKELVNRHSIQLMGNIPGYLEAVKKMKSSPRPTFKDIPARTISSYFKSKQQTLRFLFALPGDMELLHEARKIMKQLLSTYAYLPSSQKMQVEFHKRAFHFLEQDIGELHDLLLFRDDLYSHCKKDDVPSISAIEANIILLKDSIHQHIMVLREFNTSRPSRHSSSFPVVSCGTDFGHVL